FNGEYKALIEFNGKPIIMHIIDNLKDLFKKIYISVRDKYQEDLLRKGINPSSNIVYIKDEILGELSEENRAPLTGVLAALTKCSERFAFFVSGDMPLIQHDVISYLLENLSENDDAVVPVWGNGYLEPTLAVYKTKTFLNKVQEFWNEGIMQLVKPVQALQNKKYITIKEIRKVDPRLLSLLNVNDPDDLEKLLELVS
ncbi:MAG: molybdenum cofactor guanylyltransferase, partial [Promethearchaeota archaeon]